MASIKTFGVPFVKVIGTSLRQWESGRQLQLNPNGNMDVTRLDMAHKDSTNALVVIPKEKDGIIVADIPNILLQSDQDIVVFSVNVSCEKVEVIDECVFTVKKRPKPDDYVYTETEVLNYTTLEKRISDMEKNGVPGGNGGTVDLSTVVQYVEQSDVTEKQRETARNNIGAAREPKTIIFAGTGNSIGSSIYAYPVTDDPDAPMLTGAEIEEMVNDLSGEVRMFAIAGVDNSVAIYPAVFAASLGDGVIIRVDAIVTTYAHGSIFILFPDESRTGTLIAQFPYLSADQGEENAGKLLGIGAGGMVVPVDVPSGGGSGLTDAEKTLLITILRNAVYSNNQSANITALEALFNVSGGTDPDVPVDPDIPDEPDEPDVPVVTLTGITATYSGGDVAVGTAVTALTGIVVTAHYSDGSTATVTNYTLSGTIVEGENTITVTYEGMTATFTVTGVVESGGEEPEEPTTPDSEELMCDANIVLSGHYITQKSATYSFYILDVKEDSNVYEIPVEAGETYALAMTTNSEYPNSAWWGVGMTLNGMTCENACAVSATKLTNFETVGSRVTAAFDGNGTMSGDATKVKNGDGTYTHTRTFTPAISGYLYTDDSQRVSRGIKYSVKKGVA